MNFRNYNVIRRDRTNGTKGGVIICLKNNIYFTSIEVDIEENCQWSMELVGCKITLDDGRLLNVFNVYNSNGNNPIVGDLIKKLYNLVPSNEDLIILGDFNAHSKVWCKCDLVNPSGRSLEKLLLENNICLITPKGLPTRCNPLSQVETTIDLIMASPSMASIISICIPPQTLLFSDHSPIHLAIESNRQSNCRSPSTNHGNGYRFQIKRANWSVFKDNLNQVPIKNILTTNTSIDARILLFQEKKTLQTCLCLLLGGLIRR